MASVMLLLFVCADSGVVLCMHARWHIHANTWCRVQLCWCCCQQVDRNSSMSRVDDGDLWHALLQQVQLCYQG
jgi:hypothetical protein